MTCTWEAEPGCLSDKWAQYDADVQERALMLATSSLQMLTNYRVGTCPITIRPCPQTTRCGCVWNPHIRNGRWYNDCRHRSSCEPLSEIDLPGPVGYIESLVIDGEVQDLGDNWRLDDGHLLVWQGGGTSPVPAFQDLNKPDTEVGTWSVTYSRSHRVGLDGRIAVAYLANEFAEACLPKGKCSLPKNVRSVTRLGVSFTIEAGLWPNGLTQIQMVDAFILKWVPPGSPTRTAQVFDPRRVRARTTSAVPMRSPLGSV